MVSRDPSPEDLLAVMREMRALAVCSGRSGVEERLQELDARLCELLTASAGRCRELADRLAVAEEHATRSPCAQTQGSREITLLGKRLSAAGCRPAPRSRS